jgi:hypothetical protein
MGFILGSLMRRIKRSAASASTILDEWSATSSMIGPYPTLVGRRDEDDLVIRLTHLRKPRLLRHSNFLF